MWKKIWDFLSSSSLLVSIFIGWLFLYIILSIWTKEAFATFIEALHKNPFVQIPFLLFLLSGYLNIIRASKSKIKEGFRFILWVILPLGLVIFFTGFFISIITRQADNIIAGEGHEIRPRWGAEGFNIISIRPGLKDRFLDIEADSGIFAYEPKFIMQDKSLNTYEIGTFPPKKVKGTYFHILNFGIAPGIRLTQDNNIIDEGYTPLRILRGGSDLFEIPDYPYRFLFSMEPERTIQKGELKASEYNLKDPIFRIRVTKGGTEIIAEGTSKEDITFNNTKLTIIGSTFWVQVEAVKDYGFPVLVTGIFLTFIGIPAYIIRLFIKPKLN